MYRVVIQESREPKPDQGIQVALAACDRVVGGQGDVACETAGWLIGAGVLVCSRFSVSGVICGVCVSSAGVNTSAGVRVLTLAGWGA